MIALPPVLVGATHVTAIVPAPPTAVTPVGAAGATEAAAVIDAEAADDSDVVLLPLGVTVKVKASPAVRPVTVQLCAPAGGVVLLTTTQLPLATPEALADLTV